jgi:hypothetical protein
VRMADGSTVRTIGTAYKVPWRFGRDDDKSCPYELDFHIVKEAPHHIIPPEALLYDSQAFSEYAMYLTDEDAEKDEDEVLDFFLIDRVMGEQIRGMLIAVNYRAQAENCSRSQFRRYRVRRACTTRSRARPH